MSCVERGLLIQIPIFASHGAGGTAGSFSDRTVRQRSHGTLDIGPAGPWVLPVLFLYVVLFLTLAKGKVLIFFGVGSSHGMQGVEI